MTDMAQSHYLPGNELFSGQGGRKIFCRSDEMVFVWPLNTDIPRLFSCLAGCMIPGTGHLKNPAEAAKYYRQAAELGYPRAQNILGQAYIKGRGVPADYDQALHWFRKAADQNFSDAQYNLGLMYAKGHGVPKDFIEARRWWGMAAEQGNPKVQFTLGHMYPGRQRGQKELFQGTAMVETGR